MSADFDKDPPLREDIFGADIYHVPRSCEKCGGIMRYMGVGEYRCETCNTLAYDDYGKVRLYLEKHRGANAVEVEAATGVKQKTIRQLLKDARIEVTDNSKDFLVCEFCGKRLRYGRFCPQCEGIYQQNLEERQRKLRTQNLQGFGMGKISQEGEKRFKRK